MNRIIDPKTVELTDEQKRNIYLRKLLVGEIQGPLTGIPSVDKPHLKTYPEQALYESCLDMTMYDFLYETCKNNMDDVALVFDFGDNQTEITYRKLFENIDKVANALLAKGIKEGDNVAISMANTPESAYLIYALNKIGAVICLIDPRSTEESLKNDLKLLNVKAFIGINDTYKKVKSVSKDIDLKNIVIVSPINSHKKSSVKNAYFASKLLEGNAPLKLNRTWSNFISKGKKINQPIKLEGDNNKLAVISFTGGTTGVHKGVMLSNNTMNNIVFSHKYLVNLNRGDLFMDILPQFMIYGGFTLHYALCIGLKTHMIMDANPAHFVDHLVRLNPVMAFGGPVHWETLINNPKLDSNSLSNLVFAVSGGEKLSLSKELEIDDALTKAGAKDTLCNGYGASELNGSTTLKQGRMNKSGTIGRMHVYDNVRILDLHSDNEVGYNQVGRLLMTSPSLMLGYYKNPEETEKAIYVDEDGVRWFNTGDLAKIDENGDIEITGRSKRLFVCGLNNVYPPELEEIILSLPNVKKCAVVNVPDDELREVPKVHVVLENDTEENRKQMVELIQGAIISKIGAEVIPHYYEFNDDLIYTPNGKVDFVKIREKDLEKIGTEQKTYIKK